MSFVSVIRSLNEDTLEDIIIDKELDCDIEESLETKRKVVLNALEDHAISPEFALSYVA